MTLKTTLICPKCHKKLTIDSIRKHTDGRKRLYWECDDCNLSIMERGEIKKLQPFKPHE